MAYGLQLFDKNGANIMDTNERFTRVYGSYTDIKIDGTAFQPTSSKYAFMSTFKTNISVELPPTIQTWTPLITSSYSLWAGSSNKEQYKAGKYRMIDGFRVGGLNISESVVKLLTDQGDFAGSDDTREYYTHSKSPNVSAEKASGPSVNLYYTFLSSMTSSSGNFLCDNRRVAYVSFVIVGY